MSTATSATAISLFRADACESAAWPARITRRVWERAQGYEDEGSERRSLGAVSAGAGAWWFGSLTVPTSTSGPNDDVVFLRLERRGEASVATGAQIQADLTVPRSEVDALLSLLTGLVAQARRDEVLPLTDS